MRIEFDKTKDEANLAKHGVSLAMAKELDWDAALVWLDDRFEYDELRTEDGNPLLRFVCGARRSAKDC